jgi:poly(A) polymerase
VTRLPETDWLRDPAFRKVVDSLRVDGAPPRIVGGAVRDALLGLAVSDVDLATPLLPEEIVRRLEEARIKAVPTGFDHGTITAVADGRAFEITTLRRDLETDGRRATVAFSSDWQEDAARRDFTMNALYADPDNGEIFDYFGGLADIESGHVRFIGDAGQRIAEDHLRILRLFRFHARFGKGPIDAEALSAARANATKLMALSRERIADELRKLLAVADPAPSVSAMVKAGIFAAFLPEIVPGADVSLARLVQRERETGIAPLPVRRLSALLPTDPVLVEKVAARLKLSNRIRADLAILAKLDHGVTTERQLAYRLGTDNARSHILLHHGDQGLGEAIAALHGWEPPQLPIKGGDLIQMGLRQGPMVARTLQAVERQWIAEDFPSETRAREIAGQLVAEALGSTPG